MGPFLFEIREMRTSERSCILNRGFKMRHCIEMKLLWKTIQYIDFTHRNTYPKFHFLGKIFDEFKVFFPLNIIHFDILALSFMESGWKPHFTHYILMVTDSIRTNESVTCLQHLLMYKNRRIICILLPGTQMWSFKPWKCSAITCLSRLICSRLVSAYCSNGKGQRHLWLSSYLLHPLSF